MKKLAVLLGIPLLLSSFMGCDRNRSGQRDDRRQDDNSQYEEGRQDQYRRDRYRDDRYRDGRPGVHGGVHLGNQ